MTRGSALLILLPLARILGSCVKPMDENLRQEMMDTEVQRRLQDYRRQKNEECHERVMEEAIAHVDSSFRVDPIFISLDTISRPPLPVKPSSPNFELPKDSVELQPLLGRKELN